MSRDCGIQGRHSIFLIPYTVVDAASGPQCQQSPTGETVTITRFLLGVGLLAAALIGINLGTEPLLAIKDVQPETKFWWLVGAAIGGVSGGLIVGLVLWFLLRIFLTVEQAPDRLKFTLYTASILVGVYIFHELVISPPLTDEQRADFIAAFEGSCFQTQRSAAVNVEATDELLREYCGCAASSLTDQVTKKEMRYALQNNAMSPSAQTKVKKAAEECLRTFLGR